MSEQLHTTLEERLRRYANQEQTHSGLVLAHRDDLLEAAAELEDAAALRVALLDDGWTFERINDAVASAYATSHKRDPDRHRNGSEERADGHYRSDWPR